MTFKLCINRIRLEFKVVLTQLISDLNKVLIESDWNLKSITESTVLKHHVSINRIRLEFKVNLFHPVYA